MARNRYPPDALIVLKQEGNPHKSLTTINYKQYEILRAIPDVERTVEKALAEGVILNYLNYVIPRGLIYLTGEGVVTQEPIATTPVTKRNETGRVHKRPRPGQNPEHRVFAFDDPASGGIILKQGPEQSIVKFDNGNVQVMSNTWIRFVTTEETVPVEASTPRKTK